MKRIELRELHQKYKEYEGQTIKICGWVKTIRDSKKIGFIELNDGSSFKGVQVVFQEDTLKNFSEIAKQNVGAGLMVMGEVIHTPDGKQPFELNGTSITIEGESSPQYPLQKKKHSLEFLRSIAHLRGRTNTFQGAFRIRSMAAFAIHRFFNEKGFIYAHTPIITGSDCEGAGEMFRVTTLDMENIPKNAEGKVDNQKDFFGKETNLTVSGQLEGEALCMGLGNIYTFGPTFRAENSNTQRHAAEFWMVEPEIAFADLKDNMDLAEEMMQYVIQYILEKCPIELQFFNDFYDKELIERLKNVAYNQFARASYSEAIETLKKHRDKFEFPVEWGCDLQTEHERFLSEQVYKKPVFIYDYPKEIKSFYMKLNDDNKTVAATDLLVPGIGEIVGGSQREDRMDILIERMNEAELSLEDYKWYLEIREYGGVSHAGFGLGFERLIMYLTGLTNIRDVIPFPRTVGSANY